MATVSKVNNNALLLLFCHISIYSRTQLLYALLEDSAHFYSVNNGTYFLIPQRLTDLYVYTSSTILHLICVDSVSAKHQHVDQIHSSFSIYDAPTYTHTYMYMYIQYICIHDEIEPFRSRLFYLAARVTII